MREETNFKDPFRTSEKGSEKRGVSGGMAMKEVLGRLDEEDEMGDIMLRAGSDRIGKGAGVWRVE